MAAWPPPATPQNSIPVFLVGEGGPTAPSGVMLLDANGDPIDYTVPASVQGANAVAQCYLKLYNKVSLPVVGTDVPFATYYLAATSKFRFTFFGGLYLPLGIGFAFTVGVADADTAAIAAAGILGLNVEYN